MEDNEIKSIRKLLSKANEITLPPNVVDNVFSVLKMERKEVQTHSLMLSYLFENKNILKSFCENVLIANKTVSPITNDLNSANISFSREFVIENGRIDFVIWINNLPVAIEMKIDAGEQPNQLSRYTNFLEKFYDKTTSSNYLYFLTLSANNSKTGASINITFEREIKNWIQKLLKDNSLNHTTYEILYQYMNLLNKLTTIKNREDTMINCIHNINDLENISKLVEATKIFQKELLSKFLDFFEKRMPNHDNLRKSDYSELALANYFEANTYPQLYTEVLLNDDTRQKYDFADNDALYFVFEIHPNGSVYYGFTIRKKLIDGKISFVANKEVYNKLNKLLFNKHFENSKKTLRADVWLTYIYIETNNKLLNLKDLYNYPNIILSIKKDKEYMINDNLGLNVDFLENTVLNQMEQYYNNFLSTLNDTI